MAPLSVTVGLLVVLLGLSSFFSSAEISVFSLSPDWITDRAERGDRRGTVLADLREDPHRLLVTLLVGNNLVNIGFSSIVTVLFVERLPDGQAVVAATLVGSSAVLIFGEILPKAYGLANAERWSLTVAYPVRLIELLLLPLVLVFDLITRGLSGVIGGEREIEKQYTEDDPRPEQS